VAGKGPGLLEQVTGVPIREIREVCGPLRSSCLRWPRARYRPEWPPCPRSASASPTLPARSWNASVTRIR